MSQREWRPFLATKKEVLAFFEEREVVGIYSLIDRFGYSYKGAIFPQVLYSLPVIVIFA